MKFGIKNLTGTSIKVLLVTSIVFSSCISQKRVRLLQEKTTKEVTQQFENPKSTTYRIQIGDHLSDMCMQGRFARPRERQGIRIRIAPEEIIQLGIHLLHRDILFPFMGQPCGSPAFTVDTVQRADLRWDQVNTQGHPQSS